MQKNVENRTIFHIFTLILKDILKLDNKMDFGFSFQHMWAIFFFFLLVFLLWLVFFFVQKLSGWWARRLTSTQLVLSDSFTTIPSFNLLVFRFLAIFMSLRGWSEWPLKVFFLGKEEIHSLTKGIEEITKWLKISLIWVKKKQKLAKEFQILKKNCFNRIK